MQDATTNKNTSGVMFIDAIKPVITLTSQTKSSSTATIFFEVSDKYLTTPSISASDLLVYVDNELASSVVKDLSTVLTVQSNVNGTSQTVAYRYQLVLSNFEKSRTSVDYDREYVDWSGNITVKVPAGLITDYSGNSNDETELTGPYVDFIKPTVTYQHAKSTVDSNNKSYSLVFDITDKYYSSSSLSLSDLKIKIDGQEPDWTKVTKSFGSTNLTNTVNGSNKIIGKRYTLRLENLEQLQKIEGDKYLEYSGIVTVEIPSGKVSDTSNNSNNAITITSGIDLPGGDASNGGTVIDVVNPIWEKVSATIDEINGIATVNLRGTDKYFASSSLTSDKIKVYVSGVETSSGLTKTLSDAVELTEERSVNGVTTTAQYGVDHTFTLKGIPANATQLKLLIPAGTITDTSGNTNKDTIITLFNMLKETSTENLIKSPFLGNTKLERQNIENITFLSSTTAKNSTAWDVSATGDGSILAWYVTQSNGAVRVYIGSDGLIFGNPNSSNLFAYIGYGSNCTATETITNINLLHTGNVTNMSEMFWYTGYRSMTKLDLGKNFSTQNVTNMSKMFAGTGYTKMTQISLGDKFDTSNVTDMSWMFADFGNKALTSFDLGANFKTSKVINMSYMFANCGSEAMTSLNLGDNFDTTSVTDFSYMFDLCGTKKLTSLYLGAKFNTSNAVSMRKMFRKLGTTSLTSLDLGPAFVKITDDANESENFIEDFGKSGAVIYAPESIYSDKTHFRLSSSSTTTMQYSSGTINLKYMPEWSKASVAVDEINKKLTITVKGTVDVQKYTVNAKQAITDKLKTVVDGVQLYIDGELVTANVKTITLKNQADNEVTYDIELANLEQQGLPSGKSYYEWSGNVKLKFAEGTLVDAYGNKNLAVVDGKEQVLEDATTNKNAANVMFTDFIAPKILYKYKTDDIDKTNKKVKVEFSVTDKYYSESNAKLTVNDLDIQIDGKTPDWKKVNRDLSSTNITEKVNGTNKVVGVKYTLTLSHLEQTQIAIDGKYADYSGVLTIGIAAGKVADDSGNTNVKTTITMGINLPEQTGSAVIADVVDPVVERVTSRVGKLSDRKVTLTFQITDKYFANNTLQANDINLVVDGSVYTSGITKTLSQPTALTEKRTVDGAEVDFQYGVKYTLEITGVPTTANQIMIRVAEGVVTDESGNKNKQTDMILYSVLKSTSSETSSTSAFLGNSNIQRQYVDNVTFENKISTDIFDESTNTITDTTRAWDVSYAQDKSIIAWYVDSETKNGTYKIHIGANGEVFANSNSSYLFAYIGYSNKCTSTETITNLNVLNVANVTNMNSMFAYTGYNAMTSYKVEDYFDMGNVTSMNSMFAYMGYNAMTSLDLGPAFTKVLSDNVFNNTGKSGAVIYAPEAIYKNKNTYKVTSTASTVSEDDTTDDGEKVEETDTTVTGSYTRGTINPIYRTEWVKDTTEVDATTKTIIVTLRGRTNPDASGYQSGVTASLTESNINVFMEGTNISDFVTKEVVKTIPEGYDVLTTIKLSNFEEVARQTGKKYKEWSGNIVIKLDAGTLTDTTYGNKNLAAIDTSGEMVDFEIKDDTTVDKNTEGQLFEDFIKPEFTYIYSQDDINHDAKTLTVDFSVTDKYFESSTLSDADAASKLTVHLLDTSVQIAEDKITKTLTKIEDVMEDRDGDGNAETKIGEKYRLVISGLEQAEIANGDKYKNYSGPIGIVIPARVAKDKSDNYNIVKTIVIGVEDQNDQTEYAKPSEIYDADGNDRNGLHIGDFINYDAGTWTSSEIRSIRTGSSTSLNTANGTTSLPTGNHQFGGFTAGMSRNENATAYLSSSTSHGELNNYIVDASTGAAITGWRVFDINGDKITLISAGNPEDYNVNLRLSTTGYQAEYILTGNINSNWTFGSSNARRLTKRNWSMYLNSNQNAESVTVLTKDRLDSWYSKYIQRYADVVTTNTFRKIYEEPYIKYQNLIDNNSHYWLTQAASTANSMYFYVNSTRSVYGSAAFAMGVRPLITLSSSTLLTSQRVATKTLTGGHMDTYGGKQTYNVWNIRPNDEPDKNTDGEIVDVVDPSWKVENINIDKVNQRVTMDLIGTDKYFDSSILTADNVADKIKVIVDGEDTTGKANITKTLSTATALKEERTVNGVTSTVQYGVKYTLTLSNFVETDDSFNASKKGYREYSGLTEIKLTEGLLKDKYTNTSKEEIVKIGQVDFIKPVINKVSSVRRNDLKTETIIFNVMDKYLDTSTNLTADNITVFLDDEQADGLTKNLTLNTIDAEQKVWDLTYKTDGTIVTTVNGEERVVGKQYKLVLSNFEKARSTINTDREFSDWSGTVSIKVAAGAIKDTSDNVNDETKLTGEFVDFIKPNVTYKHSAEDIDKSGKTYTMVFDVTDKYYNAATSTDIAIGDLSIKIDGEEPNWNEVEKSLRVEDITNNIKYTKDDAIVTGDKVIGRRYTLELSKLEQLQIKDGNNYLDYSGVVTVEIPANKISDTTGNKNDGATITSGVNIPGGSASDAEVVDVVNPLVEMLSTTASGKDGTAEVTFRITDKYFESSTLTSDKIEVLVNRTKVTSGITKALSNITELKEQRIVNGTTTTVQYGVQYTLNISGFAADVNQVKVRIPAEVVTDESGNKNKATEWNVYNVLRSTSAEKEKTSGFLISAFADIELEVIQRQSIDNIIFEKSIPDSVYDHNKKEITNKKRAWDVSAMGDQSIVAWLVDSEIKNRIFKVHIANNNQIPGNVVLTNNDIYANQDSSYLFGYIGYSNNSTATEAITNIGLLNVSSVTNMSNMFAGTGSISMTNLDLGDKFDTSNVTDMSGMFSGTGYTAMTSLDLGDKFDTSNVTNMSGMFSGTGYTAMTNLDLGDKFDTSNVTNMKGMFWSTGYTTMTSLDLGNKFDTSNLTDMTYMFYETGYTAMTSLNLGDNFDTGKVTDMESMFYYTGYTAMTSLDLKDKFDTSNVTNMSEMFKYTGYKAMASLDLGDKFDTSNVTNMSSMFYETGFTAMTSLDLGDKFDTSNVTDMSGMFERTGCMAMTSLKLGDKFDTSNVTDMSAMFMGTGDEAMTSLSLGDKFNTKNVTDMTYMFSWTGHTAMTSLDLGPAFTKIADTSEDIFTDTGKPGEIVIQAPEAIFENNKTFKLSTESTTTISFTNGTINPKYRTEWAIESTTATTSTATPKFDIQLRGRTNPEAGTDYISNLESLLSQDKIKTQVKVYMEDTDITDLITITLGGATTTKNATTGANDVLQTISLTNFDAVTRRTGKNYKDWSGNIKLEVIQGTLKDTTGPEFTAGPADNRVTKTITFGNKNMVLTAQGTRADHTYTTATVDKNTNNSLFADLIKPEFKYVYADGDIDHVNKTLTVEFEVIDKYFANTTLSNLNGSQITVNIDSYDETALNNAIRKQLTKLKDITDTVDGKTNVKVGERYRLVISNLEQKGQDGLPDGYTYSGYLSLLFTEGTITDKSGNKNSGTTIFIGKQEPGGSDGDKEVVDVVSPVWTAPSIDLGTGQIKLRVSDKYLIKNSSVFGLTADKIKVISDGVESTAIGKTLTGPIEIVANQEYEYILTLTNVTPSTKEYTEFTPIDPIVGGTAKYRTENGGALSIKIEAGVVTDAYKNKTNEQSFGIGTVDSIGPEVYDVQNSKNTTTKVETLIFNVTDRNYDETDLVTTNEMSLWMDDVQVDSKLTKTITKTVAIKTTIDGVERVVGHQYTLEVSGFEESGVDFKTSSRKYRELSGTLQVKINENAAKDRKGNTLSPETTTLTDFVDFIKPEVTYKYSAVDIDKTNKTYKMVIDIVDKYYDSTKSEGLTADDLTIQVDGKDVDLTKVTKILSPAGGEDISDTVKYMKNGSFVTESKVIGKRYTLMISGLEQLQIKEESGNYISYSGVVTVEIPEDKISDTSSNKNVGTTITSGVDLPDGTGDSEIVDVVDPLIEMVSTSADAMSQTATVTFRATDKYFASTSFTASKVKVVVDGSEVSGVTATISSPTELKEDRIVDGTTKSVQYGVQYTVNISGFTSLAKQVKVRILADSVKDEYGNGNKQTDLIVYNVLKSASAEGSSLSGFLGSTTSTNDAKVKAIERYYIDNVIFEDTIPNSVYDHKNKTIKDATHAWDVSEMGDQSIVAWYVDAETRNRIYKIHIANNNHVPGQATLENNAIYANRNASYLFSYIGYSPGSQNTEAITNLGLLNVKAVTNMKGMFYYTGYEAMTSLDLGSGFDTSNVTDMSEMFYYTGYTAMTSLDLGTLFDTSKVVDMSEMFSYTGYTKMTSLDLKGKFYTEKVTNMSSMFCGAGFHAMKTLTLGNNFNTINTTNMMCMFQRTGCIALENLNLGSKFDTTNVTDMMQMFLCTGYTAMTTLTLGDKFNTSNVTDMYAMFYQTGYSKMTTLDLGDQFNTSKVECMDTMFKETGRYAMTILDLGPQFTKIADSNTDMFKNCGTTDIIIYAPEAIYASITKFKAEEANRMMANSYSSSETYKYLRGEIDNNKIATITFKQGKKSDITADIKSEFDASEKRDGSIMGYYTDDNNDGMYDLTFMSEETIYANKDSRYLFNKLTNLTSIDLSNFKTDGVREMSSMFEGCSGLRSLDVSNFNTSQVTYMNDMFRNCSGLRSLDVSNFNTSQVTDMVYMFKNCSGLTSLDVSNFNTSQVTDMSIMFDGCSGLRSLDVSNFNTSQVTSMSCMFNNCSGLTSLDLSNFNTSQVTDMRYMFGYCSGLRSLDVSNFDTSQVTDMWAMFRNCSGLRSLDLSNFNTSNVTDMDAMFDSCNNLTTIYVSEYDSTTRKGWTTENEKSYGFIFYNCPNLVGGNGTKYNSSYSYKDKEYARIDTASTPGYLTKK